MTDPDLTLLLKSLSHGPHYAVCQTTPHWYAKSGHDI